MPRKIEPEMRTRTKLKGLEEEAVNVNELFEELINLEDEAGNDNLVSEMLNEVRRLSEGGKKVTSAILAHSIFSLYDSEIGRIIEYHKSK